MHGDDFTCLGLDADINWYEAELAKHFELKIRGRIGEGCDGPNQIRILNRIVTLTENGLTYEADPRHVDLLSASLGLGSSAAVATPGVKDPEIDDNADKTNEPQLTDHGVSDGHGVPPAPNPEAVTDKIISSIGATDNELPELDAVPMCTQNQARPVFPFSLCPHTGTWTKVLTQNLIGQEHVFDRY